MYCACWLMLASCKGCCVVALRTSRVRHPLRDSVQALHHHLEASHDLFVYGISRDHPDVVPTVNVACAKGMYNSRNEFVQLDTDSCTQPADKVCPA